MKTDETITIYLALLGVPDCVPDTPTAYLEGLSLQDIWNAFQAFARISLECQSQIFSFEYYYSDVEQQTLSITFRRNFYIPFEDDPDVVIPLCFTVGADYRIPKPKTYEYIFFMTEVTTDLDQAVQAYCSEVDNYRPYWAPFLTVEPAQVSVFQ